MFAFVLDVSIYNKDGTLVQPDLLLTTQQDRAWWTIFGFMCITAVSFLISVFIKEDLRRLRFGQSGGEAGTVTVFDTGATPGGDDNSDSEDGYKKLNDS